MLYDYWPITERPPIEWPDGKGLAFWIGLNVEHFEPGKPSTSIAAVTAGLPVDPMNHGWRDYGTRVGVWRLMELLDSLELRASVLLNSDVCAHYPQIVEAGNERGWAWLGHGKNNSSLWTGMELEQEREALAAMVSELRRGTGKEPRGWLGPALTETSNTPELLAEQGFTYVLDWCADDQPFPLNVQAGRMISLPYSVELNDITLFIGPGMPPADYAQLVRDQFEVLHEESKRRPGAVMALSLHPFLISQPFRHKYLAQVLEEIRGHDDVWFATSDEIADWYLERHYDAAVGALRG